MHVLSASGLTHGYDGHTLFADLAFGLTTDDRVAIVGPNGSGKSTLLRIVADDITPDGGEVVRRAAARISYLPQELEASGTIAREVVLATPGAQPHEADALLSRLDVAPDAPIEALSGGQRRRVALAGALVLPSDLLILDEPTNHLDADTIDWLEDELRRRAGGLLFVTHDRYLLERLTNRMLDLHDTPSWVEGSYADVLEARLDRQQARDRNERARRNLLRKELAWLRRGPKARTSKPRFRVEQATALLEDTPAAERSELDLGTGRRRLGSQVLEASGITVAFGDHTVLDGVDLEVGPGERVGIVGRNGAGKTTLLRVLSGELTPDAGVVTWGSTVERGVYDQQARAAASGLIVLDTITDVSEWIPLANGERLRASSLAERFGFDARLQRSPVSTLSGGERRRLALLHLLVAAPNVLLLDEPTNDLDIDTLQRLEDHLDGFRGTLFVASHDRFVLERLTDRLIAVEDGRLVEHLDWESYREAHAAGTTARTITPAPDRGAANRERQARRKEIRSLETRLERLQAQKLALEQALARVADDYERAADLGRALAHVERELDEVEDAWLEATA